MEIRHGLVLEHFTKVVATRLWLGWCSFALLFGNLGVAVDTGGQLVIVVRVQVLNLGLVVEELKHFGVFFLFLLHGLALRPGGLGGNVVVGVWNKLAAAVVALLRRGVLSGSPSHAFQSVGRQDCFRRNGR